MSFYATIKVENSNLYITADYTAKKSLTGDLFKFEYILTHNKVKKYSLINNKGEYLSGGRDGFIFSDGKKHKKIHISIMGEMIYIIYKQDRFNLTVTIEKVNYIETIFDKYLNEDVIDYNLKYDNGNTLLHYAAENSTFDIILELLNNTDPRIKNDDGEIFLFKLILNNILGKDYEKSREFLDKLPEYLFNTKNNKGNNIFMESIVSSNIYHYFIKYNDDFDIQNNDGNTYLHLFCLTYDELSPKIFNDILDNIVDLNILNDNLETPFSIACKKSGDFVNLFLDYHLQHPGRLDINIIDNKDNSCIYNFYDEFRNTDTELLEKFLKCLPDFNIQDNGYSLTLLMVMVNNEEDQDLLDIVIENSDIDLQNFNEDNVLKYALEKENVNCIIKLISSGIFIPKDLDIYQYDHNFDYINLIKDIIINEPKKITVEERESFRIPYIEKYNKGMYDIEYMRKEIVRRNREITENSYKNYIESEEYSDEEILETVFDIMEQKDVEKEEFLKDENNIIFHIEDKMIGLSRIFFNPITDDKILLNCEGIGFDRLILKQNPIQYVNLEAYGVLHPNDEKIGILVRKDNLIKTLPTNNEFKLIESDPLEIIESATSLDYYKNPYNALSRLHCQGGYTGIVYDIYTS
jgi:ankyrin repeat protein